MIAILVLLSWWAAAAADTAPLAVAPGPRPVGFAVWNVRDAARRMPDGGLRPVQVGVWYPAAALSATPMRYRDYVLVSARERSLEPLTPAAEQEALAAYRGFLERNGVPPAGIDEWLGIPMLASAGAPAAEGRFPLVLLAQGTGGAVQDQAALGEFLAGRGFVVATTPSPVRLGAKMESEADVPVMAEEQARDLEVALAAAAPRAMVDAARVGVVGYSFGARPALLLAGRHRSIRALVSLDGGIGAAAAKGWLAPRALDRAALATPILHVYEETDEDAHPDFDLLASLVRAPRTLARVEGLRHLDFITFGCASASLASMGGPAEGKAEALRAVFGLTAAFLDAHVRVEGAAGKAIAGAAESPLVHVTPFGGAAPRAVRPQP
jgi:dienelactone hydrolase